MKSRTYRIVTFILVAVLGFFACTKSAPKASIPPDALTIGDRRISVEPMFHGDVDLMLTVRVFDLAGNALRAKVTGNTTMPAMGSMAEMRGTFPFGSEAAEVNTARMEFAMAGKWSLRLVVESDGEKAELFYTVNTPSRSFVFERSVPPAGGKQASNAPATTGEPAAPGLVITPERRQLIGVTVAAAEVKPLRRTIRAFGRVTVSEQSLAAVTVRSGGWVKEVFVKTSGARVRKGQPLLKFYSPELNAAQQEYLIALQPGADESLRTAGIAKLHALGMETPQIEAIERTRKIVSEVILHAPQDGIVLSKDVVVGARLEPGMAALQIGNLGKIWIVADLFEQDAPYVKEGLLARVLLPGSGKEIEGTVGYVYPTVDEKTRTLPVRLEFRNVAGNLKPGMFADVMLDLPPVRTLVIPKTAVLVSGEHSYAFVDRADGSLEPREITTGMTGQDDVQVLDGITAGERVSTSANFLLSSEALLRNALPRRKSGAPAETEMPMEGHQHGGHGGGE
jgi:Cu(I)/Ag(I) efflux system membrane fusion protein